MWGDLDTPEALRRSEQCLEAAVTVARAQAEGLETAEKRFEEDRQLIRVLDALEAMEKGEYEAAQDRLAALLRSLIEEQNVEAESSDALVRLASDWKDRYNLFLMLVYRELSVHLQRLGIERKIGVPDGAIQKLCSAIRTVPGRYGDGSDQKRADKFRQSPLHAFEFFEFCVWDAVDDFVNEVMAENERTGSLEDSCSRALGTDDLHTATDGLHEWWTGWDMGGFLDAAAATLPASDSESESEIKSAIEKWYFLHPLNRSVLHWLVGAAVGLLTERHGKDSERVVNFLNKLGDFLEMDEADGGEAVSSKVSEMREKARKEVKNALKLRNRGNCCLLSEIPPSFKEHRTLERHFQRERLQLCSANVTREHINTQKVFPQILCENLLETAGRNGDAGKICVVPEASSSESPRRQILFKESLAESLDPARPPPIMLLELFLWFDTATGNATGKKQFDIAETLS
uniref:Uncharacterized protein n=1 Tax=Chromera velia CCMP2878 TaxID=1169474 RepID=A0A0G4HC60_9ALVE|eukprot:Cvel_25993.t1-p1 / transcript=Cvel_25993.t1 / gene=Cvel_25993 / organism=Chromera_velia_CCMP2878 / gene_product=hypothetical protein / transcript_product=hypothetical protein / location=Cvel_scaffold3023:822-2198(-) / protein_length=459 / sequence_SO=supercontig / SO=protein_coding / is_pseudo=false